MSHQAFCKTGYDLLGEVAQIPAESIPVFNVCCQVAVLVKHLVISILGFSLPETRVHHINTTCSVG